MVCEVLQMLQNIKSALRPVTKSNSGCYQFAVTSIPGFPEQESKGARALRLLAHRQPN